MELEIVWWNPNPSRKTDSTLRKIASDEFGAVYSVTNLDLTQEFQLILGAA